MGDVARSQAILAPDDHRPGNTALGYEAGWQHDKPATDAYNESDGAGGEGGGGCRPEGRRIQRVWPLGRQPIDQILFAKVASFLERDLRSL